MYDVRLAKLRGNGFIKVKIETFLGYFYTKEMGDFH